MTRLISTGVLACFLLNLQAQVTFNKRQRYNFEAAVMTSVLPTDSCYYATGIIADTVFPFNTGNIFAKLDLEGEAMFIKTLESTEKTFETWENTLCNAVGGGFWLSGYTFTPNLKALLIRFDAQGDTLFTREYLNPYFPNADFIRPMAFEVTNANELVFVNWISSTILGDDQVSVMKMDSMGNVIFHKVFGNGLREIAKSVAIDHDGSILAGGKRGNNNLVNQNYTFQTYLIGIDSLGNENWAYLTPTSLGLRDAANDMVLLEDGSLVIASGVGHEQERASVNVVWFDKHIFKLNPEREIEWELTFPDEILNGLAKTTKIIQQSDGSGFVVAGVSPTYLPAPIVGANMGWLAKVSNDGDSVWTRKYVHLTEGPSDNVIYDLKEAADGGFIACGEARDISSGATYPQQGWLLKLDAHGCLIPGCHLLDATGEEERPGLALAIYPNPTKDYLNFQLRGGSVGRTASFRITDLQGQVVRTFESATTGATHIVPVWDWGAGVYFLQYVEDGAVRATERFVVTK